MSFGPSCVLNFNLSAFDILTYLNKCLANSIRRGPGLLPYQDNTFSAYIIDTKVYTIPYIN